MGRYEDLMGKVIFGDLEPFDADELAALRSDHPDVPDDYVEFLTTLGAGTVGRSSFMLYGTPMLPTDVYDSVAAEKLGGLLLLGDDFQGYCVGYDPSRDWAVVEVDPTNHEADVVARTFEEFVRGRLLKYEA